MEWEAGLPSLDDLIPLSQCLISPELKSAFNIDPDPCMTIFDVHQVSRHTLAMFQPQDQQLSSCNNFDLNLLPLEDGEAVNGIAVEGQNKNLLKKDDSKSKILLKINACTEGEDLSLRMDNRIDDSKKTSKRQRIVWTPQLHKRFIDVVDHIGIQNAVPNTIIQMMNVEGLTRDNVASHLQKYRLYLNKKH
ncbi:transcription factor BOA-like [Impatiens glandulifera]|uniref:transcription factor BOA-like n=1 Tax=Impatiens glandulifera TaxID=253017 RepID=UPI001FB10044|nr:transcription factor BOA-like [Impatiens glandulifera]